MSIISFQGTIKNGQVYSPTTLQLPDNTAVTVIVSSLNKEVPTLQELIAQIPSDYTVEEDNFGLPAGKEVW